MLIEFIHFLKNRRFYCFGSICVSPIFKNMTNVCQEYQVGRRQETRILSLNLNGPLKLQHPNHISNVVHKRP